MSRGCSPQDLDVTKCAVLSLEDRPAREQSHDAELAPAEGRSPSPEPIPGRSRRTTRSDLHSVDDRAMPYDRDCGYRPSESEIRTIAELGRFHVIASHSLSHHAYAGRPEDAAHDIQNLVRKGLVRKGTFEGPEGTPRELLALTKRGYRLLRANRLVPQDQAVYHGFVKPREANHDADLYLLYQQEAVRIEKAGGKSLRVILDYELRRKVNRDLARFGGSARKEIAELHGLRVVGNKIPIPDMRIEYETHHGEMERVNLELVTEHYRGRSVTEKVRAGFSLYTAHGEASHLRRVLNQRALTAEVLSL